MFIDRQEWLRLMAKAAWMGMAVLTCVLGTNLACVAQEATGRGAAANEQTPGCERLNARACLDRAMDAMGGREKLAAGGTVHLDAIGHTELMEQSYRQEPFIASYSRAQVTVDHAGQRLMKKVHPVWPEADLKQADCERRPHAI